MSTPVVDRVIELMHHEPFEPFVVEFADGREIRVPHPRLAVNDSGAGFIDEDGGLVDIDFAKVRDVRVVSTETCV